MRRTFLALMLMAVSATCVLGQNIDRYFTEFKIADVSITTAGVNGGVGGFTTDSAPIYAQAVVWVEEAQRFTWEWVGLTEPGTMTVPDFPNIVFEATSNDTFEFRDLEVDLNPTAPNKWGSGQTVTLDFTNLEFDFHYESFSFESDTSGTLRPVERWFNPETRQFEDKPRFGFYTRIRELNYSDFPESLIGTVELSSTPPADHFASWRGVRQFLIPSTPVEIEPFLGVEHMLATRAGQVAVSLHHTPTGDANNDGTVGFDDFLILSSNFGEVEAAWADGDFDRDGSVAFTDFLGLSANFGAGPAVQSVPEPVFGWWLLLGVGTLTRWFTTLKLVQN